MAHPQPLDDEPAPDTASSSAEAADLAESAPDLDSPFFFDDTQAPPVEVERRCAFCDTPIIWAGKSRPKYCLEHRDPKARKPPPAPARIPAKGKGRALAPGAQGCTLGYGLAGFAIANRMPEPFGPPLGRMMQMQAPDAGPRLAKNLQPLLKQLPWLSGIGKHSELATDLAAILGPPLLVCAMIANPNSQLVLGPLLQTMLAPIARALLDAQEEQAATIGQLTQADADSVQAVQEMLAGIFGGPPEEDQ